MTWVGIGCQSAAESWAALPGVRLVGDDPSASITHMSVLPTVTRLLVNAIFVPSGENAGSQSSVVLPGVRFTGEEPSAFITNMS